MTREEAIEVLQTALTAPFIYGKYAEALDMAIESLSAEQKEEELAKDIARRMATIIENEQDMRIILKNASADRPSGEWIERWERRGDKEVHVIGERECSVCHAKMLLTYPNYCPNCGAKMDEVSE